MGRCGVNVYIPIPESLAEEIEEDRAELRRERDRFYASLRRALDKADNAHNPSAT